MNHIENITSAESITTAAPRPLHWAAAKLVLLPANWLTCAVISIWTWGKVVSCDSVIASHRLQLDLFSSFYWDRYSLLQYLRKGNNIKIHPNMPQYILKMLVWKKHFSLQLLSIYYSASPLLCYKLPYFCLCSYFTLISSDFQRYKKKKNPIPVFI